MAQKLLKMRAEDGPADREIVIFIMPGWQQSSTSSAYLHSAVTCDFFQQLINLIRKMYLNL